MPSLALPSTQGGTADLSELAQGRLVAYVYPRTGVPGQPSPAGWDDIPGARGCTPQSCSYRDSLAEFERLGASVIGLSAQGAGEQREFAEREHIPFPLLSDSGLELAERLGLPTFEAGGMTLGFFVSAAVRPQSMSRFVSRNRARNLGHEAEHMMQQQATRAISGHVFKVERKRGAQ